MAWGAKEEEFIRKKFGEYYKKTNFSLPDKINEREWGFGNAEKKIHYRHVKFGSEKEFRDYLSSNAPLYCSYSVAHYNAPDAQPMEKKGWKGAELIFDLDANHLPLPCISEHGASWSCPSCLGEIKRQTISLVEDFLLADFGFSEKDISVNWSGNRGYHIHVQREDVLGLDADARRDVVDYVSGAGMSYEALFTEAGKRLYGPRPGDGGWRGRLANFILRADGGALAQVLPKNIVGDAQKLALLRKGVEKGEWDYVRIPKTKQKEVWSGLIAKLGVSLKDEVDKQVTADVSRLIRCPETLHGETGMKACRVKFEEMEKFEPTRDATVFGSEEVRIFVESAPKFLFDGVEYGPFAGQNAVLPEKVALYLLCKKRAVLG